MEIFICSSFDKWTVLSTNNCRRKRRGDFSNNSFTGFTVNICALRKHPFNRTPIRTLVLILHYTSCCLWRTDSYVRIQFSSLCDASRNNMNIAYDSDTVKVPAYRMCKKHTRTCTHTLDLWSRMLAMSKFGLDLLENTFIFHIKRKTRAWPLTSIWAAPWQPSTRTISECIRLWPVARIPRAAVGFFPPSKRVNRDNWMKY